MAKKRKHSSMANIVSEAGDERQKKEKQRTIQRGSKWEIQTGSHRNQPDGLNKTENSQRYKGRENHSESSRGVKPKGKRLITGGIEGGVIGVRKMEIHIKNEWKSKTETKRER